jgi:adenylate kinase family enzyme
MVLFTGPAGAGKSTLARAWCATRPRTVHVELDEVRHLIVSGLADPRVPGPLQAEQ